MHLTGARRLCRSKAGPLLPASAGMPGNAICAYHRAHAFLHGTGCGELDAGSNMDIFPTDAHPPHQRTFDDRWQVRGYTPGSNGCIHHARLQKAVSTAPKRLTDGDSGCVQRLQYLRHDHSCIGVVTEPARHVSVRPAQQRTWWCASRPKLPVLPKRGEAQAWSLAKPVQTPMAGFKPLSQESNRASSC